MMDYETRKVIARLEARIRELEARLAISSMPDEVSALLDDLEMVPDTEVDERVSLEMIEEFIKDMGYKTQIYPELNIVVFTDLFKEYELHLCSDDSIELVLLDVLDPDVDWNILYLLSSTKDVGANVRLDQTRGTIEYKVQSIELKPDTFRDSIRFFINLLNDSAQTVSYDYTVMFESKRRDNRRLRLS